MPLDPAKLHGRLFTCGGLITVGAVCAGAIASVLTGGTSAALTTAASILPGVAGSILASDYFELAKRFRPSADVLRNHDLSKAVGMAIAIVILKTAENKDPWTKTRLEALADKAVKFWVNYTIESDSKYLGIREDHLTALFDKSAADFAKVTALDRWEDWLDILNCLCVEEIPKIDLIPETVLEEIAKKLHTKFPQALREVLKQNPVAFAGMMLLLMGEFITEIRESKTELASKCDLILAEVQEIKSRNSNLGESFQLPQIWLDSFQSWMRQVESGLRDELRAIAHTLVTIETQIEQVQETANKTLDTTTENLDTTKRIEEKIDKIIPQQNIDLSDPHLTISEFIGREEEINQLHQFLAEGKKQLIGITGVGGMGKSTLAAKIYAETRFLQETGFLGQFWVDIFRNPEMRIFAGMARLVLRQFLHLPEDSPILKDEQNLHNRLLNCLQNNKYLLVIDNLETLLQYGQFQDNFYQQFFKDWLGYGGKSVILVTTQERWNLPSDNCVELTGFKPEAGATLLKVLGITGSEEGLQAFSQRVKGHPLALKLVAGFLKEEEGENADISFLDRNPLQISGWHRSETVSVEEVLAASFNRLDERLKRLLLNVSVYRLRFNSLAAAAVMEEENVEKDLRLLVRKSLLQEERENRQWWFQFQPLVLEYVRGISGDLKEAHERAIDYYKSQVKPQPWETLEDVMVYLEIFYHRCQLQRYEAIPFYQQSIEIYRKIDHRSGEGGSLCNLGNYYQALGQYQEAINCYQQALAILQPIGHREFELNSLYGLGNAYAKLGESEEAILFYQQSIEICRKIDHRSGEGGSLCNLGNYYQALGQYQEAINCYQQALAILQPIGHREFEANSLIGLGNTYHALGKNQEAIPFYQQSIEIYRKIDHRSGEGGSLCDIGNCYQALGQYQEAICFYLQSLEIARQISNHQGEGISLYNLGNSYQALGEYQEAINYYQQALAILQPIGDREFEANSLHGLGNTYHALGKDQEAIRFYQQWLEIAREIGDKRDEGSSLGNLGLAYDALGQYQEAIRFHLQSLEIARQIQDKSGEGSSLCNIGNAYQALGQYEEAIRFHLQSLEIEREIGDKSGEGGSLCNLGNSYQALGECQKAINCYQQALAILQPIGHREFEANSLKGLGYTYQLISQYQQAIDCYEQLLQIRRETCDRVGEANCLQTLSPLYYRTGRIQQGIAAVQTASEILMEIGTFPDDFPLPEPIKSVIKFAQGGKWQLALCLILLPFGLLWFVMAILWQIVQAQFRRCG